MSTSRRGLRGPALLVSCVAIALVLAGTVLSLVAQRTNSRSGPTTLQSAVTLPPAVLSSAAVPGPDVALSASFEQLRSELGSDVGLAYAPVGAQERVITLGTWSSGPAWSTIKIPLSLALMRELGGVINDSIEAAVTASSNQAAQSVWEQLGDPMTAASKVRAELTAAGDPDTQVQSEVVRSGFSAFGQTYWPLAAQTRFLAHIACDEQDAPVLDLMGRIVPGQRWGIGAIDGAKFKGGWGPGLSGGYLVRQYGLLETAAGQVAVAVATATLGGFDAGIADLDRVATWLTDHLNSLPGGRCH